MNNTFRREGSALKVTHVVLSLECGGLERVVVDLVREGRALGQEVSVVCLERPGVLAGEVESLGVPVVCLKKREGLTPGLILRTTRVLQTLRPDIVHTHQVGALLYSGAGSRGRDRSVFVHTEHGDHVTRQKGRARRLKGRLMVGLAARLAERFFCVSEEIGTALTRQGLVDRSRVRVVPNGIDVSRFGGDGLREKTREILGISPEARVIGTVGRLNEVKCQDLLIKAFARVAGRLPDARLLLVGDGPRRERLETLVSELSLEGRVHFAGYQKHVEGYLAAMDVFALTSRSEGMPLSVLEAWASGLPVIASAVGGLPKLITEGQTGLLFPNGDMFRLESCISELFDSPTVARDMGEAGRDEVRSRHSVRGMARSYAQHYEELLRSKHGRALRLA